MRARHSFQSQFWLILIGEMCVSPAAGLFLWPHLHSLCSPLLGSLTSGQTNHLLISSFCKACEQRRKGLEALLQVISICMFVSVSIWILKLNWPSEENVHLSERLCSPVNTIFHRNSYDFIFCLTILLNAIWHICIWFCVGISSINYRKSCAPLHKQL